MLTMMLYPVCVLFCICTQQLQPGHSPQPQSTSSLPPPDKEQQHLTPKRQSRNRFSISSRRKPPAKPAAGGRDEADFPGGDAMREAYSRLQTYQQNLELQLDVSASV